MGPTGLHLTDFETFENYAFNQFKCKGFGKFIFLPTIKINLLILLKYVGNFELLFIMAYFDQLFHFPDQASASPIAWAATGRIDHQKGPEKDREGP